MTKLEDILNKHSNSIRKITDINDDILDILVKLIEHIESNDMKNDRLFEVAKEIFLQSLKSSTAWGTVMPDNDAKTAFLYAQAFMTEYNRITGEK